MGGSRGSRPKKFRETNLRVQLINFTQKLDFTVLWFRKKRAYKIQKKKEKKRKNLIAAKSGLIGIKGNLKKYNRVKCFMPYTQAVFKWNCFLRQTFGAVFGYKIKVTRLITAKCGTNMQMNNLKLQSKFIVAWPNHSRVISKSLKIRI